MKKVDMIVDMQYGSTGKGLIAGYLAMKNEYDTIVNANMPNSGHTFIDGKGNKMVHKVLPNGIVSPRCKKILIGPGSILSIAQLAKEINQALDFGYMKDAVVLIHPNAVLLESYHAELEQELESIGSTQQGSSAAMIEKIRRNVRNNIIMRDHNYTPLPGRVIITTNYGYNVAMQKANSILAEGAQGFSLGINEQFYPFCTSRDCSPARFMSDMAIPISYLRKVIGTCRTYPIRVGGNSGGHYADQKETSWEELGLEEERTTVTNRTRRVFTFSEIQIRDAIYMMAPDEIFLNFCNYIEDRDEQDGAIDSLANFLSPDLRYLGWGPTIHDIEDTKAVS